MFYQTWGRESFLVNAEIILKSHMDAKPLIFDITRYVQRCDDHTVVCETYPSACGFGWSFLWSEGMRHWINAWDSIPASWAAKTSSEAVDRRSRLAFSPASLPHEPAKPYLPTRMKKEQSAQALLFLLLIHTTLGEALLFIYLFICMVETCLPLIWLIL